MISIIMLSLLFACTSEGTEFDSSLVPVKSGERWGYVNLKGEYEINPQFDEAYPFLCGYACVKKGDKYGYINKKGEYVIQPLYSQAQSFYEGVAWVTKNGSAPILINTHGEELLEMKEAERCYNFSDGYARVLIYDNNGNAQYRFIDQKGNFKGDLKYAYASNFIGDLAYAVVYSSDSTAVKGFISKKSSEFSFVLPDSIGAPYRDDDNQFKNGLAIVKSNNGLEGLIDKKGKYVLEPKFDVLESDNNEWYICKIKGSSDKGWCDKTGKIVINPQFENALPFGNSSLAPVANNDEWGFVDKEGKIVINSQFEFAMPIIDNKVAFVESGNKFGIIDLRGKYIANPQFDEILGPYFGHVVGRNMVESITTEYYDINKAVGLLDQIITQDKVDGLSLDNRLEKTLIKYGKEDISPYSATSGILRVSDRNIGNMFDMEVALEGNFVNYVSDGWWGSTPILNKNAKPNGFNILVKPTGRGSGRSSDLMKAYAKAHGVANCDDDGANFVYGIYDVTLIPNIEGFNVMLYPKAGAMSAYDPEEDEIESESNNSNRYTGKIDGKYDIVMELNFNGGGEVAGSYYYKSKNTPISLEGKLTEEGMLILEERVNGEVTGNFAGQYKGSDYSGIWVSPDGGKEMPFKVTK